MQLCEQGEFTFFSSEVSVKSLFSQNSKVPVLWIMPLLIHFVEKGKITSKDFFRHQINLIESNYSFVGFSEQTLFAAAESGNIKKFENVIDKFLKSEPKEHFFIRIMMLFLIVFRMNSKRNRNYQIAVTHVICNVLIKRKNEKVILDFMKITIKGINLIPFYLVDEIVADIDSYKVNES